HGKAAEKLNAFATRCFKGNYPSRARAIWLEILKEYDTDNEVARKSLGFVRVGATWAPDSTFVYPAQDQPDPAVARILGKQWDSLAGELGKGHRDLAQAFAEAGDEARAKHHFARALRFLPDDVAIAKQS